MKEKNCERVRKAVLGRKGLIEEKRGRKHKRENDGGEKQKDGRRKLPNKVIKGLCEDE